MMTGEKGFGDQCSFYATKHRRSGSRPARTLSGQASVGRYEHTRAALLALPQPLWGYWEQRGAMSTVV